MSSGRILFRMEGCCLEQWTYTIFYELFSKQLKQDD